MKTKKLLFSLLFVFAPLFMMAQTWQEVGMGGFSDGEASFQKVALDGLTPYVAYADYSYSKKITVKKFNGSSWETVGTEGFGEPVDDLDFVIENGLFYIAYSSGSSISVMKLAGGQWVYEGPSPIANGSVVSLAVSDGIPFIAYQDSDFANKLSAKKLTSSGWAYVGGPGFTACTLSNVVDIEVDGTVAYVAYRDTDHSYKASVMKFDNGVWSVVGNQGFSGATHDTYNSLAIYNNKPYVTSWNNGAQGAVYTLDGTNWQQVGSAISTGQGKSLNLKTSPLNELYIAYSDGGESNQVFVKKLNGSSWVNVGNGVAKLSASFVSMAFNSAGQPYLGYKDNWYIRKTTVMTFSVGTSVENSNQISDIQVYPNPAENVLNISNNGNTTVESLEIYDQVGHLIWEHKSAILGGSNYSHDISNLPNGLYFVQTRTKSGVITHKFIKH